MFGQRGVVVGCLLSGEFFFFKQLVFRTWTRKVSKRSSTDVVALILGTYFIL